MTRALDGKRQLALILCACTRHTAWKDLALIIDKAFQYINILIIDVLYTCLAEKTLFIF